MAAFGAVYLVGCNYKAHNGNYGTKPVSALGAPVVKSKGIVTPEMNNGQPSFRLQAGEGSVVVRREIAVRRTPGVIRSAVALLRFFK